MPTNKKRKLAAAAVAAAAAAAQPASPHLDLQAAFEKFEDALCKVLSCASVVADLHGALGDSKANFVNALQTMVSSGSVPWVVELPPGPSETCAPASPSSQLSRFLSPCSPTPPARKRQKQDEGKEKGKWKRKKKQPEPEPEPEQHPEKPQQQPQQQQQDQSRPYPPPLPPIPSPALLTEVFTPYSHLTETPGTNYERLEWLGDTYLEAAISRILHDRYPTVREGSLNGLRQRLVTNKYISALAALYKFEDRILGLRNRPAVNPETGERKRDVYWKTLADTFEAYIAAVVISNGHDTAVLVQWLAELYAPELRDEAPTRRRKVVVAAAGRKQGAVCFSIPTRRIPTRRMAGRLGRSPSVVAVVMRKGRPRCRLITKSPSPRGGSESRRTIAPPRRIIVINDNASSSDWEEIIDSEPAPPPPPRPPPLPRTAPFPLPARPAAAAAPPRATVHAKQHLESFFRGNGDAELTYVHTGTSSSGPATWDAAAAGKEAQEMVQVSVLLKGWGWTMGYTLGSGWGRSESEAGEKAARNILGYARFGEKLEGLKKRYSELQKATAAAAAAVLPELEVELEPGEIREGLVEMQEAPEVQPELVLGEIWEGQIEMQEALPVKTEVGASTEGRLGRAGRGIIVNVDSEVVVID